MADLRKRVAQDRGGAWFADTTCIACDVARLLAPGLIAEGARGLSYFTREPASDEEKRQAWRAMLACPSASIGGPKPPDDVFPWELTPGVWMLGYNARHSFGATSWLVPRPDGNLMIDAPRWVPRLAERIEAMGGVKHILLTHRDDVADHDRYAERFGARVWIHEDDRDAAPDAATFREDFVVAPGVRAIVVPGHTEGSAMFLVDDTWLFTGDSLEWTPDALNAFEDFTWFSWAEQKKSLARLAEVARFEWVLPGHGAWGSASREEMRARLLALVERM